MKWARLFNCANALVAVLRIIAFLRTYYDFAEASMYLQNTLAILGLSFVLRHSINERQPVTKALRGDEAAMKKYLEEKK